MSRKNTILIIVIVLMLGGAAFIIYRGFFAHSGKATVQPQGAFPPSPAGVAASPSASPSTSPPVTGGTGAVLPTGAGAAGINNGTSSTAAPALLKSGKILPLGARLDLTLIKKYNADGKQFNYPTVSPSEVGPALSDIIKKGP